MLLFTLALVFPAMAVASVSLSPPSGTTLATLTLGQSMSVTLTAIGGAAPYAYWQGDVNDPNYDGNATYIPAGLSLDTNTGVLSGTPT
ncbi:MAG: putative Ig domain-containing protein, partial [Microvirgula sp.]